ncbi:autotransporter outer membrane beta-barrel domain-containing protein [uncultured Fusobacterium sp.]|uniref:autotransporter outer membrane beta-barrel domain-containing protein n=1 Tax=uncultured Fusobacterium sp. TaxID=159267 RepID=UPI00265F32D9|nr:autotransporter outer membrane beta-barrel domain-containing protein [uncultured Fusobacterium sp.]
METKLKGYLKGKIRFSTGLLVIFLITGTIGFAKGLDNAVELVTGSSNIKEVNEKEYEISANNHYNGVMVGKDGKLTVNSENINITNNTKGTGKERISGIQLRKGGTINLGNDNSNITISINTDSYAAGINTFTEIENKSQKINIKGNRLNIISNSISENSFGIFVGDTQEKNTAKDSEVNIIAKDTVINVTASNKDKHSMGLVALDEGIIRANSGNISINAQDVIRTSRKGTVEINKDAKKENIVKLDGNIVFKHDNREGENINSNVNVNLSNEDSIFNGKIYMAFNNDNQDEIPDSEKVIKDLKLTISNGATWNIKGVDEKLENNIFGDIIVKDGGVVNHSGISYVYNNDGNDKGLQLQGGAILNGTGKIQTGRNLAGEDNTEATNVITVSNAGNIINGSDLTLNGNVNMLSNSALSNRGSLITSGTIKVGSGATFTNEKGATLKGSSNKHLIEVTGGTAINNGTIDLSKTTGSIAMKGDASSTLTNNGTVIVDYKGDNTQSKVFGTEGKRTNTNTGKVQINGYDKNKNGKGDKLALENLLLGENAKIENSGMFVDENGVAIVFEDDSFILGNTTELEVMKNLNGKNSIDISKNGATIKADSSNIEGTTENGLKSLNVNGELTLAKGDTGNEAIEIENITTNISGDTKIIIGEGATANFTNGTINGIENKTAIELSNNGTLGLKDMVVKGDIVKGTNATTTTVNMNGNNSINGKVDVSNVNISSGESTFGANSSFGTTTIKVENDGKLMLDVATDGTNAFLTTDKNNGKVILNGNFGVTTEKLTEDQKIELGKNNDLNSATFVSNNDKTQDVYITDLNKTDNVIEVTYNKELLSNYGDKLNNINNAFQVINDEISQKAEDRAILADKVYAGTIYAETVRMAYDNSKLVENELVKINPEVTTGEWVANGKALFMKNRYDRDGILSSYNSEKESTGLLAVGEYGLDETTNVGLAFAGIKHKLDTDTGKADGDAFYFGTFAKKQLGDYRLNAGLGYELNRFDADEKIFGGSEKYDANVYSAYVEGRYVKALGDDLRVEPKLKLGYTYVDQNSVKDGTYDMESQDISVFDTELGADFIKTVALKDGKLNGIFSLSYTLAFGDTDDEFTGRFYNSKTVGSSFNMMGAEIAERSLNLGAGLEVTKDTGLFYNGGVTFKTGSDSYRDYGFTLGAGYKF